MKEKYILICNPCDYQFLKSILQPKNENCMLEMVQSTLIDTDILLTLNTDTNRITQYNISELKDIVDKTINT
jgi:hypothetical protein